MANARTKTEQKTQDDEKVTQAPQKPVGDAKPQPKSETKKSETPETVSFQDLDEPNENLPGVVPPKKEN